MLKKPSDKCTQKKSPTKTLQQHGWHNEMLKPETNASMIHQPIVSRTEWKCENVRCNYPAVAVRLPQTICLACAE